MLTFENPESLGLTRQSIQTIIHSEHRLYRIRTGACASPGHLFLTQAVFTTPPDTWQIEIDSNLDSDVLPAIVKRIGHRIIKAGACRLTVSMTNLWAQKKWEDEMMIKNMYPGGKTW